jgi:hypothetical protein
MEKQLEDLKAIREMMEKSSKFLSLSGLSGVFAGTTAIAGAATANFYILKECTENLRILLLVDALVVLAASICFAFYFSWRKAQKNNQKLFNQLAFKILYNLCVPLVVGGVVSLILIYRDQTDLVAAMTLIFYGLALVNVSKFTFNEIHYLGIIEILLGLAAILFLYHGLLFWTIGFGLCHIVYGIIMYKKYDLK